MFHISVKLDQQDRDHLGRWSGFSSLPGGRKTNKHQIRSNLLVTNEVNQTKSGSEFSLKNAFKTAKSFQKKNLNEDVCVFSSGGTAVDHPGGQISHRPAVGQADSPAEETGPALPQAAEEL